MNQIKANNGVKKPIPMRAGDLITERVKTLSIGSVASRLLSDDANQIANISNDVSMTLISVSSLLRVMADAMAVPLTDRCSTDEDKVETLFAAASLVDVCQVAVEAGNQARRKGGNER